MTDFSRLSKNGSDAAFLSAAYHALQVNSDNTPLGTVTNTPLRVGVKTNKKNINNAPKTGLTTQTAASETKLIHADEKKTGNRVAAFNDAFSQAKRAIRMLESIHKNEVAKKRYEKYFGKYSKENYAKVSQAYKDAVHLMKTGVTLRFNAHICPADSCAGRVIMGDRRSIYYGPGSLNYPNQGQLLLHEMMHNGLNMVWDDAYGREDVLKLAIKYSLFSIRNADTYVYYAYDY